MNWFFQPIPAAGLHIAYQFLTPDADVSDGSWTNESWGTELYSHIDETVASDSDFIHSSDAPSNDACRIRLSNPTDQPGSPFDVLYRYKKSGTGTIDLTVKLYQGVTEIASWSHTNISSSYSDATQTLTAPQFAAITDFDDLEVEFIADVP